jgi:hypothetical protein
MLHVVNDISGNEDCWWSSVELCLDVFLDLMNKVEVRIGYLCTLHPPQLIHSMIGIPMWVIAMSERQRKAFKNSGCVELGL